VGGIFTTKYLIVSVGYISASLKKYISLPGSKIETCMSVIYAIVIFFVGHTLICGG
jgi:hypothetical protein